MRQKQIDSYLLELDDYFMTGKPIEDICGCCYLNIEGLIELLDEFRSEMNEDQIKRLDKLKKDKE